MDFYGLHEMHQDFGFEVFCYGIVHAIFHATRYVLRGSTFIYDNPLPITGWVAFFLFPLVVLPFKVDAIRKSISFEYRKALHYLSLPAMVALALHLRYAPRTLIFFSFLLCLYGLDYFYTSMFNTFRVDAPHLFPIGNGTLVEFKAPHGFSFKSGQYVYVCAPYIAKNQWHAFSVIPISSADGNMACSFYALAAGDWTKKLLESASKNVHRPLWVNGGYPSPFDISVKYDYLFLICTGVGITPGISVISQYCYSKKIVLLWSCRHQWLIDLYQHELQVGST